MNFELGVDRSRGASHFGGVWGGGVGGGCWWVCGRFLCFWGGPLSALLRLNRASIRPQWAAKNLKDFIKQWSFVPSAGGPETGQLADRGRHIAAPPVIVDSLCGVWAETCTRSASCPLRWPGGRFRRGSKPISKPASGPSDGREIDFETGLCPEGA